MNNIESRLVKLENRRPRRIDGRALMDKILDACERARTPQESDRIMHDMIVSMTDEELKSMEPLPDSD